MQLLFRFANRIAGWLVLSMLLSLVVACGGGGGSPAGSGITISGTVTAASNTVMDSDTNDPYAPFASNNEFITAQSIPNPATVGGFVTATPTWEIGDVFASQSDPTDRYRATLYAGQTLVLTIADIDTFGVDLDLFLYAEGDTSSPIASSEGFTKTESITVPTNGTYYIVVLAFGGASSYTMNVLAPTASAPEPSPEFVPGEIILRLKDEALPVGIASHAEYSARHLGLELKRGNGAAGRPMLFQLPRDATLRQQTLSNLNPTQRDEVERGRPRFADDEAQLRHDTLMAVKALRQRTDVRSADPNYIHQAYAVPNDSYYGYQWHYPLINLPQAWDIETGASNPVTVAVVDTGVYLAHPDLSGKLVPGYDFISNAFVANDGDGIDANPDDPGDGQLLGSSSFHGTHVAGTIAASTNNATGVAGVSWGARIMPIRVLGVGGGTSYDIMQGNLYAAGLTNDSGTVPATRADIINLSLGCQNCYSQTEQDAYTQIRNAGVIVIAAAGNSNASVPGYPASYAGVVSVSAVDYVKARAPYSNYGAYIDVAAPGGDSSADRNGDGYQDGILSTLADDSLFLRQATYDFYQGTSMAAPHMAGVVALMKARNPAGVTPASLDSWLQSGSITEDVAGNGATVRDNVYGYGLIDAVKAVQAASGSAPTILSITPNPLNFGSIASSLGLSLGSSGSAIVHSVTENAAWLSITPPGSLDGLGTYTVNVDRSGLVPGTYSTSITISYTVDTTLRESTVAATMTVNDGSASGGGGDTGFTWLILIDTATLQTAATINAANSGGNYDYLFRNVGNGQYYILAGSDSDNDDVLCEEGESCGGYPTLGSLTRITVAGGSVSGVDFGVTFPSEVGASALLDPTRDNQPGFSKWPETVPNKELN